MACNQDYTPVKMEGSLYMWRSLAQNKKEKKNRSKKKTKPKFHLHH